MELTHRFSVPTSIDQTWAHFDDIAGVGQCFPGAQVTSVDGDSFAGTAKIKLGPIALVYTGTGTFVEKDESAHRMVIDAKGKDKRGNGTAGANVVLTMVEGEDGSTDVEVQTDLAITGKPAQFGRGVMQDVSDKLLGQFVDCLSQQLNAPAEEVAHEAEVANDTPVAAAAAAAVADGGAGAASGATGQATPRPKVEPLPPPPPAQGDALNLGATVLPVLAKTYGKQILVGIALLLVLRWLFGRRKG